MVRPVPGLCVARSWRLFGCAAIAAAVGCQQSTNIGPVADAGQAAKIAAAFRSAGGETSSSAAESTGTGWATLKGRFTFLGDPPPMPAYVVNKDEATCAPGGKAPPQEWLKVGDGDGLANVAIYARSVSRVHESAEAPDEPLVFDQKQCVFLTHVAAVVVGQTIEIKNSDDVGHNTNIAEGSNKLNQTIPVGQAVPFVPQKEDASPAAVRCSIHPWMLSYLLARKNGYVSITGPDGSFELANLPAGEEIEIQVWHEASAGVVPEGDVAKEYKWTKKGRFKIKLDEDETRELDLQIPASLFAS
ncbi:MAG: hypothetical protein KF847_06220 [Pirellulales bacterium]|nr:hypothetical protein [Pirellulales bacterium]